MAVIEILVLSVAFVFCHAAIRHWCFDKHIRKNLGWLHRPKVGYKYLDIDETYARFLRSHLWDWNFRAMERYE